MIDLITGHQGIPHISAEQVSTINNVFMYGYGQNSIVRLYNGTIGQDGLAIVIGTGYWRANGYDMQVTDEETIRFDPTEAGLSRIDVLYAELLQDIPSGVQRIEFVVVQGEADVSPSEPPVPTQPQLTTDELQMVLPIAKCTISENTMTMTDLTIPFKASNGAESLAPEFDSEFPYVIGDVVENEGTLYKFIADHTGPWDDADVEETTVAALLAGKADNPVPISQGGTGATSAAQARTNLEVASQTDLENTMDLIRGDNDEYSSLTSYTVGRYVVVKPPLVAKETIYKCISPCSPGSWAINQSHFQAETLTEAVTDLNEVLTPIQTKLSNSSVVKMRTIGPIQAASYGSAEIGTNYENEKIIHIVPYAAGQNLVGQHFINSGLNNWVKVTKFSGGDYNGVFNATIYYLE